MYTVQMLEGLAHLHSRSILHRDIKPANVFLAADGRAKLGDMNVSKLVKHGLVKTQIGTPYYMSPELYRNRPYDDKNDLWALGCVVYEMCTGRPPFRGRDIDELRRRVQAGYYPRLPSTFSADLSAFVSQLLQVDPRRRPSAQGALDSRVVSAKRAELRRWQEETMRLGGGGVPDAMLATMIVPRGARKDPGQLADLLPSPQYVRRKKKVMAKGAGSEGEDELEGRAGVAVQLGREFDAVAPVAGARGFPPVRGQGAGGQEQVRVHYGRRAGAGEPSGRGGGAAAGGGLLEGKMMDGGSSGSGAAAAAAARALRAAAP